MLVVGAPNDGARRKKECRMKKAIGSVFGRAALAAVAVAAMSAFADETYQVTANGITGGIDLTAMAGYDALSLAGPGSGDIYMTGTVVHASATVANPFTLVGKGGGLNMYSTGLNAVPLKFTGTSGYFDFQNENFTLGDDWQDKLQLPSSGAFTVSLKTFDLSAPTARRTTPAPLPACIELRTWRERASSCRAAMAPARRSSCAESAPLSNT